MSGMLGVAVRVIAVLFVLLAAVVVWHALVDLAWPFAATAVVALGVIIALRWVGRTGR